MTRICIGNMLYVMKLGRAASFGLFVARSLPLPSNRSRPLKVTVFFECGCVVDAPKQTMITS